LPELPETEEKNADIAWFIYDLIHNQNKNIFELQKVKTVYTKYLTDTSNINFENYSIDDFWRNLVEVIEYGQE